ncbi:GAF domain-containing protein [Aestuariivirga litoralis]|uniref:GAF domain-containing protein n=1 Tax=Aestuariivirga litoralis TaxID=2650924 RepID=UPI001AEEFEC5|nr:GAF domain-containing protein [Aestuariivirga litoralis]
MDKALVEFRLAVSAAKTADAVWNALEDYTQVLVGWKLFTVMTADMKAGLARRAYSSDTKNYPVSGTKPIERNKWFDIVHGQNKSFVANTIKDIAEVFPDHELIWSLGLGSVINLPVVLEGNMVATINILHAEHHYTPQRVEMAETFLAVPAMLAVLAAQQLEG